MEKDEFTTENTDEHGQEPRSFSVFSVFSAVNPLCREPASQDTGPPCAGATAALPIALGAAGDRCRAIIGA
jgi:hypothetical protein